MKWSGLAKVIAAAALVLAVDYPWGDGQGHAHWATIGWVPFVSPPVHLLDIAQNIMLGSPVGVSGALYFRRAPLAATLITMWVSLTGKWTQVCSHARFPSATDIVCNVGGAVAAAMVTRSLTRRPERGL